MTPLAESHFDFDWERILNRQTVALERLANAFCPEQQALPSRFWTVFIETTDKNGAGSYTYRTGESGDTAEEAVAQAVEHLRFTDPDNNRIGDVFAARVNDVTMIERYRFSETPQFQMK